MPRKAKLKVFRLPEDVFCKCSLKFILWYWVFKRKILILHQGYSFSLITIIKAPCPEKHVLNASVVRVGDHWKGRWAFVLWGCILQAGDAVEERLKQQLQGQALVVVWAAMVFNIRVVVLFFIFPNIRFYFNKWNLTGSSIKQTLIKKKNQTS